MQINASTDSSSEAECSSNSALLVTRKTLALLGRTGASGGTLLANAPMHAFDAMVGEDLVLVDEEDVAGHSCLRVLESLGALDSGRSSLRGGFLEPFLESVLQSVECCLFSSFPHPFAVLLELGLGQLLVFLLQAKSVVSLLQLIVGHTVYFGLLLGGPLLRILDALLADSPLHTLYAEVHKF